MKRRSLVLFTLMTLAWATLFAQSDTSILQSNYPDSVKKGRLAAVIATESAFYLGGMGYLQYIWYKDHDRVDFHLYNDAAGYLQLDKCGHAFGAYLESYLSYEWLRRSGVSRNKAIIFGGLTGAVLQFPIEVFDGIYQGWGFSLSDVATNTTGSALVVANELLFKRQLIKYKFSFRPSIYYKFGNGYLGDTPLQSLFYDYNAHTYWLNMPVNALFLKETLPSWLCLGLGYSANGMYGEFKNAKSYRGQRLPTVERYRQVLFSLDIDPSAIHTKSKVLNSIFDHMFWIKIPMPAIEWNTKDGFRAYGLYW